jgi:hypothetical protein
MDSPRATLDRSNLMPAKPGKRQRAKPVQRVEPKRGRRPQLAEIEPLFSTYDAEKPPGSWFDETGRRRGQVDREPPPLQGALGGST